MRTSRNISIALRTIAYAKFLTADQRWRDSAHDRQVAEGRDYRCRNTGANRHWYSTRWGDIPDCLEFFLHPVLDKWFEQMVKPRLRVSGQLVRYADDFVMTFESQSDARRVLAVLGKRLGQYGLELHQTKTRVIDFRAARGKGHKTDANFDFLGYTHVWGSSRRGYKVVRQVTSKSRFARAVKSVNEWCKANRH